MLVIRKSQLDAMQSGEQPAVPDCPNPKDWIEIQLVDDNDQPVANAAYQVKLPDGSVKTGRTDANGVARFAPIISGQCSVSFPEIHAKEWQPA